MRCGVSDTFRENCFLYITKPLRRRCCRPSMKALGYRRWKAWRVVRRWSLQTVLPFRRWSATLPSLLTRSTHRPLTYSIPKQLIPIANRPVVHYVMDHLRDVDIREVGVIVAPETAEQVKTALADNPWRFALSFILQDQPLGLAHALLAARDFLGSDPFVMYLGDNLIGSGLRSLLEQFRQESADAVLLLKAVPDPRRFG